MNFNCTVYTPLSQYVFLHIFFVASLDSWTEALILRFHVSFPWIYKALVEALYSQSLSFQTCINTKNCVCVKDERKWACVASPTWAAGEWRKCSGKTPREGLLPRRPCVETVGTCPTCTASFILNTFWSVLSPWVYLFFEVGSVPHNKHENKWPCVAEQCRPVWALAAGGEDMR